MYKEPSIRNTIFLKKVIEDHSIMLSKMASKELHITTADLKKILANNTPLNGEMTQKLLNLAINAVKPKKAAKPEKKNLPAYAKTIKSIMTEQKISLKDLAEKTGKCSSEGIRGIINGNDTTTKTLRNIGDALGYNMRIQFTKK